MTVKDTMQPIRRFTLTADELKQAVLAFIKTEIEAAEAAGFKDAEVTNIGGTITVEMIGDEQ